MRIVRPDGFGHRVHLVNGVGLSVHAHIQAEVEEVLVNMSVQPGSDDGAVLGGLSLGNARSIDNTGQLYFQLD